MIVMWKDEQFGLTFLTIMNIVNGPHGKPWVASGTTEDGTPIRSKEKKTFSYAGASLIMVYCMGAAFASYNFLIAIGAINRTG
eukprot:CAMPEP_0197679382 /NCGR_PEP_ID=MMETSP1338-20131121/91604_1 /TAXON_ID=43686 ORGANISM="Pelagodinium beii, Strain RCC1491" /NCGR_SAMPLE_ID=MMETSP1338 /ASSEMBLY_ACC=CAM_ASM_000754 /LENGTH=82 /DNA_ID=CAMNT_0043260431 /DNA_START=1 /DNA_END=245 /DNA_ORIENTATION=-